MSVWSNFLTRLLTTTVSAAAGAGAGALTANPVMAAAAQAAAAKAAGDLLGEFLPAQQDALERLENFTKEIHLLATDVHTRVRAHQSGPGRAALLHIEDAERHPERAIGELELARRLLYEAWGGASDGSQRAFAAQQLSAVYAFLGNFEDSCRWLERALPDVDMAVKDALLDFAATVPNLPFKSYKDRDSKPTIQVGYRFPSGGGRQSPVAEDRLAPALMRLVEAQYEALSFRKACLKLGVGGPWPTRGDVYIELGGKFGLEIRSPEIHTAFKLSDVCIASQFKEEWRTMRTLRFAVKDGPWESVHGQASIVGSVPELGGWDVDRAIALSDPAPRTLAGVHYLPEPGVREAYVQILQEGSGLAYVYVFVPNAGGPPKFEPGKTHQREFQPLKLSTFMSPMPHDVYFELKSDRLQPDRWNST